MGKEKLTLDKSKESVKSELEHLDKVLNTLKEGLGELLKQKNVISDYLVEYRKQAIEENRFDEDKPLDAFDHEMFAREEAFKATLKKIGETEDLIDVPYFGKINFTENNFKDEIYVGKYGYIDEKNYEPLVIDWRAPIASLFYHGGLGEAKYSSPDGKRVANINNRRQFIIKNSEMLGMFDTEMEIRDEILQYVLSSSSNEKLKDIIMTIQKEQDEIIRFNKEGVVVVNGVAGSGKTTIALHRIAYLIYNYRKMLENNVLILGPNNIFMEYISSVLPTLGEKSVKQNTIWDFIKDLIDEPLDILPQEDFIESINSGDNELYEDAKYKRSTKYLNSIMEYAKSLETSLYEPKEITFLGEILMTKDEMLKDLTTDFSTMALIRRAKRIKRILIERMKFIRNNELRKINKEYKDLENKVTRGDLLTEDLSISRKDTIRKLIEKVLVFRDEIRYLGRGSAIELYKRQNTLRILTNEDLIPILYLKHKIEGIKLPYRVKYLVIDEAQDLSINSFKVLKEILGCNDMTIVGDNNQRLVDYGSDDSFTDLDKEFSNVTKFNLYNSYRSTDEIVKYADSVLGENRSKSLRHGDEVVEINVKEDELLEALKTNYKMLKETKDLESVALITRDIDYAEEINRLIKNDIYHKFIKDEDGIYNSNTLLLSAYLAKGLEFDGVILIDNKKDKKSKDLIKYIMTTRALHNLVVINVID